MPILALAEIQEYYSTLNVAPISLGSSLTVRDVRQKFAKGRESPHHPTPKDPAIWGGLHVLLMVAQTSHDTLGLVQNCCEVTGYSLQGRCTVPMGLLQVL